MKGIIALIPIFIKARGIGCRIFYEDRIVDDIRSCENFLKNLCDENNISKRLMKKSVSKFLKVKRNLPWLIDQNHVFFPISFQKSQFKEMRRAYVNANYVKDISNSSISLKTGETISTLQKDSSLIENYLMANLLLYKLRYERLKEFIITDGISIKNAIVKNDDLLN